MAVFGPGVCLVIVPCGAVLLGGPGCSLIEIPFAAAHCCAALTCWPTKFGSGGPALTMILTGCGCGVDVPAAGSVLITTPAAMVADGWLMTCPGVSPACRSAACAAARSEEHTSELQSP